MNALSPATGESSMLAVLAALHHMILLGAQYILYARSEALCPPLSFFRALSACLDTAREMPLHTTGGNVLRTLYLVFRTHDVPLAASLERGEAQLLSRLATSGELCSAVSFVGTAPWLLASSALNSSSSATVRSFRANSRALEESTCLWSASKDCSNC